MLMRAYRESFQTASGGKGLTQEELLRRMGSVDSDYAQRFSRTTVSRWESGATRPNRERLEVFGRALNLPDTELEGLISLAGFDGDGSPESDDGGETATELEAATDDGADSAGRESANVAETVPPAASINGNPPTGRPTVYQASVSCLLPGLAAAAGAFLLASLGWNESWMPTAYIGAVVAIRLGAAFLRFTNPYDICELFCVSVFVLLTTPMLQTAALNADHYGLHQIGGWAGTPAPYLVALLVNLALSTVAGAVFFGLWKWEYGRQRLAGNPVRKAAAVVAVPAGLVYAVVAIMADAGVSLQIGVGLAFLCGACIVMLLLRNSTVAPNDRDRRFLLWAILTVGLVLTSLGVAVATAVYLIPNLTTLFPEHNWLYLKIPDYASSGYTREEALQRLNAGYLWHSTAIFVYMVFVVGGNLVTAAYRWGSDYPSAAVADASTGEPVGMGRTQSDPARMFAFLRNRVASIWRWRTGPD